MAKKFPDLTGDGKVTQKDILKGRGVLNTGGKVKKKKGYSKGGAAGGKRKGKVRGVRIASKGFRPAKMVKMKGS